MVITDDFEMVLKFLGPAEIKEIKEMVITDDYRCWGGEKKEIKEMPEILLCVAVSEGDISFLSFISAGHYYLPELDVFLWWLRLF